jgi:hypothetical protein
MSLKQNQMIILDKSGFGGKRLKNKGFDVKFEMPHLLDKSHISHLQD